jgi:serine/threonine protein kinase
MTRIGTFEGKAAYSAPEQVMGERVDRRADICLAGANLWELITGRRMRRGFTQIKTLRKVVARRVPFPGA